VAIQTPPPLWSFLWPSQRKVVSPSTPLKIVKVLCSFTTPTVGNSSGQGLPVFPRPDVII
jgi:hypothetical protein